MDAETLVAMLQNAVESGEGEFEDFKYSRAETFEEAGVLTSDIGFLIVMDPPIVPDRKRFFITVQEQ